MRFVPVNCIREGMICGKRLLGGAGELLLNSGAIIHTSYIERIKELGYSGIYIEDDLSKDIEIVEIINDDLRFRTVKTIKNAFITINNGKKISSSSIKTINTLVNDIVENIMSSKHLMVNMVDLKVFDDYTFFHSVNVGILSIVIGTALNLNKSQLHNLGLAAMLHDIGKIFAPKEILNKPGKLTKEEFEIIKAHPLKGYEYLKDMFEIPVSSYIGVLHHHERYDGVGYPSLISGEQISLFGRIITVADVYDALTSNRSYRGAILPSDAAEFIMGGSDSSFDPLIVSTFIQKIAPYPIGTCVLLSDGKIGIVVENYGDCCLRPKIKIVKHGKEEVEPYYLDLRSDRDTFHKTIVGISDFSDMT